MEDLPKITPEELALYRCCCFVHQVFGPRPSYRWLKPIDDIFEWVKSVPHGEEGIDFEVIEDGWDHEHCDVCSVRIEPGDSYWMNEGSDDVDLCEQCYLRVLELNRAK